MPEMTVEVYNEIFAASGHQAYQVILFPDATHAILKSETYNIQSPAGWDCTTRLQYLIEGKRLMYLVILNCEENGRWIG